MQRPKTTARLEWILARAAELDARRDGVAVDGSDAVTDEELVEAGKLAGLSETALRQAIAEDARAAGHGELAVRWGGQPAARWEFGLRVADATAIAALDRFLAEQGLRRAPAEGAAARWLAPAAPWWPRLGPDGLVQRLAVEEVRLYLRPAGGDGGDDAPTRAELDVRLQPLASPFGTRMSALAAGALALVCGLLVLRGGWLVLKLLGLAGVVWGGAWSLAFARASNHAHAVLEPFAGAVQQLEAAREPSGGGPPAREPSGGGPPARG